MAATATPPIRTLIFDSGIAATAAPATTAIHTNRDAMLWLALHFPSLPLDLLGEAAQHGPPLAVVEQVGNRRIVVGANAAATQAGVRTGMTLAAASVLDAALRTKTRDPQAEHAALDRLANH